MADIIHFEMSMVAVSIPKNKKETMYLKLFVATFQETTQYWFIELLPKSIKSFNALIKVFIANYAYNKLIRKESHNLFSIVQKNNETKETYMTRFKTEKMKILQYPDSIAIKTFYKEIKWDTSLFIELIKTTPWFLDMIYEEAQKLVNVKRELNSTKGSLNRATKKPIPSNRE